MKEGVLDAEACIELHYYRSILHEAYMGTTLNASKNNTKNHRKVLIVEDDGMVRGEIGSAFQTLGIQTIEAVDAENSLLIISAQPNVLVVLSDINMPGRSGIELAEELLATRTEAHAIEVVLLSGHADNEDAESAARAGVLELIRKPARLMHILSVVNRAMDKAESRRRAASAACT